MDSCICILTIHFKTKIAFSQPSQNLEENLVVEKQSPLFSAYYSYKTFKKEHCVCYNNKAQVETFLGLPKSEGNMKVSLIQEYSKV